MPRALTMLARRMGGCAARFGGGEEALVCFDGTTRGVATCVMRRPSCRAIECGPAVRLALTALLLPSSAQRWVGAWRLSLVGRRRRARDHDVHARCLAARARSR